MEIKTEQKKKNYLKRVNDLYKEIKEWIKDKNLIVQESNVEINEENTGKYNAPELSIKDKHGKQVAKLQPIGAWIIGAEGRVDIVGILDRVYLVYLQPEGPYMKTTVSVSSEIIDEMSRPLFKGVDKAGWYWIDDKLRSKAHFLNSELLMELLSEVSDYEL